MKDLRASSRRADEVVIEAARTFQSHERAQGSCGAFIELAAGKRRKSLRGLLKLRDTFGLPASNVGGFESAGVVFVFRLAVRVRGRSKGPLRGTHERVEIGLQHGAELVEDGLFGHEISG